MNFERQRCQWLCLFIPVAMGFGEAKFKIQDTLLFQLWM
jgi:hypothetical protein